MEEILFQLYQTQPNFKFGGNINYWKGKTANQTIGYRSLVNSRVNENGLTLDIEREILKWGGIFGFKQYSEIEEVIQKIDSRQIISAKTASAISSYSKIFAFYKPEEYFILDARVCYVYNKLILNHNLQDNDFVKFDINRSRNKRLKEKYRETISLWRGSYVSVEQFYPNYCEFVKSVYDSFIERDSEIFTGKHFVNNTPEIIEMFLFFLADYV
jgi:hypothetical protein